MRFINSMQLVQLIVPTDFLLYFFFSCSTPTPNKKLFSNAKRLLLGVGINNFQAQFLQLFFVHLTRRVHDARTPASRRRERNHFT